MTVTVHPQYIDISGNDTVTFSCSLQNKGYGISRRFIWGHGTENCPYDYYYQEQGMCDTVRPLWVQCWCDDTLASDDLPIDGCPNGTTTVTFEIKVADYLVGEWECVHPTEGDKARLTLHQFGKLWRQALICSNQFELGINAMRMYC